MAARAGHSGLTGSVSRGEGGDDAVSLAIGPPLGRRSAPLRHRAAQPPLTCRPRARRALRRSVGFSLARCVTGMRPRSALSLRSSDLVDLNRQPPESGFPTSNPS